MYRCDYAVGSEEDHLMEDPRPPITPSPITLLPQTLPQKATAPRYVCVAIIQWYPVAKSPAETSLPQSPSRPGMWSPHTPSSTGQHYSPTRAFYSQPLSTSPCSAPRYSARKARDKEPRVAEALLGCAILLVIGILLLTFLYYLSGAR